MRNLYDLLTSAPDPARVVAWARGEVVAGMPALSPAEARALAGCWEFWARPGQRWTPGPEFITDIECGRGWGKNYSAGETICDASDDPERWGGEAIILGPDPRQVKRDSLSGPSGVFAAAERRADAGVGPGIRSINYNDRVLRFEAPRGGGGGGLTVHWGASSDPKSGRGLTLGLAVCDEFGVWYHREVDEQGTNLWQAIIPAMRGGPDPKVIITQTPSRAPEVRELQRDAERPECPACRTAMLAETRDGKYTGEPGREPWRLPSSPQVRLHPLLNTRTTVAVRECPTCGGRVVARVRIVFGATTDNPMIAAVAREQARRVLAAGTAAGRQEWNPQGEADSGARGTLVRPGSLVTIDVPVADTVPDRWAAALAYLGAEDVVVCVDPAVTAKADSDESGVVVTCLRHVAAKVPGEDSAVVRALLGAPAVAPGTEVLVAQAVALQDWSVRPDEVEGAPSAVWGPRAYWLALLWGAKRIVIEVNNGGAEVLSLVRGLLARPPTERELADRLASEFPGRPPQAYTLAARRMAAAARVIQVEETHRKANKPARFEWFGEMAARGEVAVAALGWLGGARHWATSDSQLVNFEPARSAAPGAARNEKKDRADARVAAAQILLGVQETADGRIHDPRADSWLGKF